jgi:hypothetical protein
MLPLIMLIPSSLLYTNMVADNLGNLEEDDRFKDVERVRVAGYSVQAVMKTTRIFLTSITNISFQTDQCASPRK